MERKGIGMSAKNGLQRQELVAVAVHTTDARLVFDRESGSRELVDDFRPDLPRDPTLVL